MNNCYGTYDNNILNTFRRRLQQVKGKKIAIYGTGKNATIIYKVAHKYNIVGFLDRDKKDGEFFSYPIIDLPYVAEHGIEAIIVVAAIRTEMIVFNRLKVFCRKHQIGLYGLFCGDLFEYAECIEKKKNNGFTKELLYQEMDNHSVISCDLFDTLVMRKVLYPTDVFDIVEGKAVNEGIEVSGFKSIRIRAELNVLHEDHCLPAIYQEIKRLGNISEQDCQRLMVLEKETEKNVIILRDEIAEALRYAKEQGKKVYIITDMYHDKTFLAEILQGLGFISFDDIFISGEYGCGKTNGLFSIYKDMVASDSYLHIGDSFEADIAGALVCDIEPFYVKSSREMFADTKAGEILPYLDNVNERSLVGLIIAKKFNSPFVINTAQRIKVNTIKEFAYLFVSPLITGFVIWLIQQLIIRKTEAVLFTARDGYLIKQLYDFICTKLRLVNMPRSIYFYTSRISAIKAGIAFNDSVNNHFVAVNENMERKFQEYREEIIKNQGKNKLAENNMRYFNKIGIKYNGQYALYDMISQGTILYFLQKKIGANCIGIFLKKIIGDLKSPPSIYSYLCEEGWEADMVLPLETILSSPEPSVEGFDINGNPVFERDNRSHREMDCMYQGQEAIREYFFDYIENLYVNNGELVRGGIVQQLYLFCRLKYSDIASEIFEGVFLNDSLTGKGLPINIG